MATIGNIFFEFAVREELPAVRNRLHDVVRRLPILNEVVPELEKRWRNSGRVTTNLIDDSPGDESTADYLPTTSYRVHSSNISAHPSYVTTDQFSEIAGTFDQGAEMSQVRMLVTREPVYVSDKQQAQPIIGAGAPKPSTASQDSSLSHSEASEADSEFDRRVREEALRLIQSERQRSFGAIEARFPSRLEQDPPKPIFVPSTEKKQSSTTISAQQLRSTAQPSTYVPTIAPKTNPFFMNLSRAQPSPIAKLKQPVVPGTNTVVEPACYQKETEGRRSVAFLLPEEDAMPSIYTPVRQEPPFPSSATFVDAKVKVPVKETVAPIPFRPSVRFEKVSGQTFGPADNVRYSQAQPVRYFDPEEEDDRSQLEEVLSHRDRLHEEALTRRLQCEKEELRAEVEHLKRENELSRSSNQFSNGGSENNGLLTELMKLILAQNQPKESRVVVDSALDWLRSKSQDVEAWFQAFERVAIASGWSEKIKGEMLPVKLVDEALTHWETLDLVFKYDYQACRKFLIKKLDKANATERISSFYARCQRVDENVEDFSRDLMKLAVKAFEEISEETRKGLVSQKFGQGLRREIREKLASNDFSKLAESIEAAKRVERFLKESSKPTMTFETDLLNAIDGDELKKAENKMVTFREQPVLRPKTPPPVPIQHHQPIPYPTYNSHLAGIPPQQNSTNWLPNQQQHQNNNLSYPNNYMTNNVQPQWNCHQLPPPLVPQQSNSNNISKYAPRRDRSSGRCYVCDQPGHLAKQCPSKNPDVCHRCKCQLIPNQPCACLKANSSTWTGVRR